MKVNFSKILFSEAAHAFDTETPVLQFLLKTLMFTIQRLGTTLENVKFTYLCKRD